MALTSVELGVLGIMDRFAYQARIISLNVVGGTDVWSRVDAVDDEDFENTVKGINATALDAMFENIATGLGQTTEMRQWLADVQAYFAAQGYAGFGDWLRQRRLRVDYAAYLTTVGQLSPTGVAVENRHGPADAGALCPGLSLGTLEHGGSLAGAVDQDASSYGLSPILMRVTAIGTADMIVTPSVKLFDDSTVELSGLTVLGTNNGGAAGDVYVLGAQAINGSPASGQKVVPVANTEQFKAGQVVLLTEWTGDAPSEVWAQQEYGVVASVSEDASITLEDNLLHSYSASGYVYPTFVGLTAAETDNGTEGDAVAFYPAADRRLKL